MEQAANTVYPDDRAGLIPGELENSTDKILQYAGISRERAAMFKYYLQAFNKMKNRYGDEQEIRKIREAVIPIFFEAYEAVLKKVLVGKNQQKLYRMFLQFGYMDENLLTPDQTNTLYELTDLSAGQTRCAVYDMQTWLETIYRQKVDPSINEFGQDYFEVFRQKRKRGEVSDKDKARYDIDSEGRLRHETGNLLRIGQRLSYGQMSGYFPVFNSSLINKDLTASLVTPERIEASLDRILEVDFSAFHRELVYNQSEKGITKELIMKQVLPEFILAPTFGSRIIMWQELTGRVRSSAGRFLVPAFTGENLDDLLLEAVAKFRWDLSRTMFSYSRNDETPRSLADEYANYLQFYKKNRDLSNEAKEKIKIQVDKYRNNVGEIFVADYCTWVNHESKGLIRLNKVLREIMFKHCPFSEPIRANLEKHPLYNVYITRFNNLRSKQVKSLEAHYFQMTKNGKQLDPELAHNLQYYKM